MHFETLIPPQMMTSCKPIPRREDEPVKVTPGLTGLSIRQR